VLEREQERWVYVWKLEGKGKKEENNTHLIDKHAHTLNTTPNAPPQLHTYYDPHFLSYLLDDGSMDLKPRTLRPSSQRDGLFQKSRSAGDFQKGKIAD